MENRSVGIHEPWVQNTFAQGHVYSIRIAVQNILFELPQGQPFIILEHQLTNVVPIIPIIQINKEFTIKRVVDIKVVGKIGLQSGVSLFKIIFIVKIAKWIKVIITRPLYISPIVKRKNCCFRLENRANRRWGRVQKNLGY